MAYARRLSVQQLTLTLPLPSHGVNLTHSMSAVDLASMATMAAAAAAAADQTQTSLTSPTATSAASTRTEGENQSPLLFMCV